MERSKSGPHYSSNGAAFQIASVHGDRRFSSVFNNVSVENQQWVPSWSRWLLCRLDRALVEPAILKRK